MLWNMMGLKYQKMVQKQFILIKNILIKNIFLYIRIYFKNMSEEEIHMKFVKVMI